MDIGQGERKRIAGDGHIGYDWCNMGGEARPADVVILSEPDLDGIRAGVCGTAISQA